jgi:hypothetical protein
MLFFFASCHEVGEMHMIADVVSRMSIATRQSVSF